MSAVGEYPDNIQLSLPRVPGEEGVGTVIEIGDTVNQVAVGQRVIIGPQWQGTWRLYGVYNQKDLHVVSDSIPIPAACMLAVAPSTAYRMIQDFWPLPMDSIHERALVQNAANSPCGQCVIQLAKAWGIKTYNIVSCEDQFDEIKEYLLSLGATCVLTLDDAEALSRQIHTRGCAFTKPILGLNCLENQYRDVVANLMSSNGVVVSYGRAYERADMYARRIDVDYKKFLLKDWIANASPVAKMQMYNEVTRLMAIGVFKAPLYKVLEFRKYRLAFRETPTDAAYSSYSCIFDYSIAI